jgi:hypothetical protein
MMARIRTIKPEFFTSEDIVSLSPLARIFYIALWCESDREGRLEWKPGTFKMRYLPGDECSISSLAEELESGGLIVLYEVDGKKLAQIPSFKKHQVINNREAESLLPAIFESKLSRVPTRERGDQEEGRKGRERKEGKGRERKEGGDGLNDRFDEFWAAWPKSERKQDRLKCAEKWRLGNLDEIAINVLADVETKKLTQKWQGGFIEAPEVYLNNRRWEDGVTPDEPFKQTSRQKQRGNKHTPAAAAIFEGATHV